MFTKNPRVGGSIPPLATIHADSLTSLRALDSTFDKIERCLSAHAVRIKTE